LSNIYYELLHCWNGSNLRTFYRIILFIDLQLFVCALISLEVLLVLKF
jgi:hypothetical protein